MNNKLEFWKKKNLDTISPSFCAAKWKQVTIHLQNGHTHSCHHPSPHKVPLNELQANPSALHNTNHKKEQRKLMLEGHRPAECDYCWKVEDNNLISDRVHKSMMPWAESYIPDIVSKPWDDDVAPSYVEISFGHVCNFKCSYCSPQTSSKWMEEIEKFGYYPTSSRFNNLDYINKLGLTPIPNNEENPYVDAFWKWWPTISDKLEHFRITGGEPLLNKNTYKFLDDIIANPRPNLDVSINANMCPPDDLLDKFIEKAKIIVSENKVKTFRIFTSAEAYGKQAEYIRNGMDYDQWLSNIERVFQEVPGIIFTIMSTYNALSVPSYIRFLEDVLRLKKQYYNPAVYNKSPITIDIPYLRWPQHQSIFILTEEFVEQVESQVTFMFSHLENRNWHDTANVGFYDYEAEGLKRIYEMMLTHPKDINEGRNKNNRRDFKIFVDEHDRRRGTNFLETFPELTEFYNHCSSIVL